MDTAPHKIELSEEAAALKKKRLWRNIFLFNLCVTIFLIGIFWVPFKVLELNDFVESPSVNLPQKGLVGKKIQEEAVPAAYVKNILPPKYMLINASSDKDWVFFDFSRGDMVDIHDQTSLEWDLAFRRGKVITNGGATNKFGTAGVQDMGEVDFDTVTEAPLDSYIQDSATRTETENTALNKWYKYNYLTHKLTAKKNVFAIRTAKGKYTKVQFLSFYCANKETGCIKMRYVFQKNGNSSFMKTSDAWSASEAAGVVPKEF